MFDEIRLDKQVLQPAETQVPETISVIVITREEDIPLMHRMIGTLPSGVEVSIVITKQADVESFELMEGYEDGGRTFKVGVWSYVKFNFSKARNYSIELASNEWLLWMDSDDMMLDFQREEIVPLLIAQPSGVGGVKMVCTGVQPAYKQGEEAAPYSVWHCRAFRKSSGAIFRGLVHEQIIPQIEIKRFTIVQSSIIIAHMGYVCTKEEMIAKVERNVRLLSAQVGLSDYCLEYYEVMLKNQLFTLHDMKGIQ